MRRSRALTPRQAGEKWGVSRTRVAQLCKEGRVPGARKVPNPVEGLPWLWEIPDQDKPDALKRGWVKGKPRK